MNIPNTITVFRLLLIPAFVSVYFSVLPQKNIWAIIILLVSGLSDMADGYIARKYDMVTDIGKIMDPIADKLMIFVVFLCIFLQHGLITWMLVIVAIRELGMLAGTLVSLSQKRKPISASKWGKGTTVCYYLAMVFFILEWPGRYSLLLLAIILAFLASLHYFRQVFCRNKQENIA